MKPTLTLLTALLLTPLAAMFAGEQVPTFVAKQQAVQILAASAETADRPYLAFPATLDLGAEVLVSFKHGRAHAGDADATTEWLRFDKASNRKLSQDTLAEVKGEIMQMGEWVRFPNRAGPGLDIMRLEFNWEEVRGQPKPGVRAESKR